MTGGARRGVVLVGRRAPALAAARRLGLFVVLVDERPPRRGDDGLVDLFLPCRFGEANPDPDAAEWNDLAARLATGMEGKVGAVFATTERAVVPASELRARLGLPGDSPETARRATDKLAMKHAVLAADVPCASHADAAEKLSVDALVERLGLPLVYKGRISSGGRKNKIFHARSEIARRLRVGWMAEGFIDGLEMSVETLVQDGRVVFFNPTEYFHVRWANILPAPLPDDLRRQVEDLNRRVLEALGIRDGFTHLELFLTTEGPVFGEVAVRPPGGWITELIELAYEFDPWEAWLRLGLGEQLELPRSARRAAGMWLLHPGRGTVQGIRGVEEARAVEGIERVALRARVGQVLGERLGAGQEVGHLLVTGADRDAVAERLTRARELLRIDIEPPPR